MKIVVIGGGSTGLVYGSKLSEVADTTILVRREDQARLINELGTTLQRPDCVEDFKPKSTTDVRSISSADLIIGLTKCLEAKTVGNLVKNSKKDSSVFLCLHNGIGTLEIYNELIGAENVLGGVTYLGANRTKDNSAILGKGVRTLVAEQNGESSSRVVEIVDLLSSAGFNSEISTSLNQTVWDKMVLAVGQHALCAITGLSFKQILASQEVLSISEQLLNEAEEVAKTQNIFFEDSLFERAKANLGFGADHYSSMYQDVKARRPTEIDFINGSISRLGMQNSIPTPVNDTITALIKGIESAF